MLLFAAPVFCLCSPYIFSAPVLFAPVLYPCSLTLFLCSVSLFCSVLLFATPVLSASVHHLAISSCSLLLFFSFVPLLRFLLLIWDPVSFPCSLLLFSIRAICFCSLLLLFSFVLLLRFPLLFSAPVPRFFVPLLLFRTTVRSAF